MENKTRNNDHNIYERKHSGNPRLLSQSLIIFQNNFSGIENLQNIS